MRHALHVVAALVSVAPLARAEGALELQAVAAADRVTIRAGGRLFTEYLYAEGQKFPYFFPLIGPRSGVGVTTIGQTNYPHHSSLWFGCDKVNGGNYWQAGLEAGRIASRSVRLVRDAGEEIVFEQDCEWVRPDAPSPFKDRRRIAIRAPSADRREIDFDIALTALGAVRIEKTNHSLFSARLAPELSVRVGGVLRNAEGLETEKGTFGKPSAWMDGRGTRATITEGLAILVHPSNPGFPPPWFTRDYGFFSPTPMFWPAKEATEFAKGDKLRLRYRVIVHGDNPAPGALQAEFDRWANMK